MDEKKRDEEEEEKRIRGDLGAPPSYDDAQRFAEHPHQDDTSMASEKQKLRAAAMKVMLYQKAASLSNIPSTADARSPVNVDASRPRFRHSMPYPLSQELVPHNIGDIDGGSEPPPDDAHLHEEPALGTTASKYAPRSGQDSPAAVDIWQPRSPQSDPLGTSSDHELRAPHDSRNDRPSLTNMSGATSDDPDLSALTPAERRNLFKTQSSRDQYMSHGTREEVEMVGIHHQDAVDDAPMETDLDAIDINVSANVMPPPLATPDSRPDFDIEDGRPRGRERRSYDEECENCGPLNGACTFLLRFYLRTKDRLKETCGACGAVACTVALVAVFVGICIFLGVFPKSFRYIEYYQYALAQNSITNSVDRDITYYPGCYVLYPAVKMITYNSTAHHVSKTMGIFTSDKLSISLSFNLQYFLKPEELGKLHAKFELDYDDVLQLIIVSTIRNEAGQHRIDDYRHKRSEIERLLHWKVKRKLGGTCCESCCPTRCSNYTLQCLGCWPSPACDQAYHVDVRYFQMEGISIIGDVSERYTRQTLLKVEAEREHFIQEHAVTEKVTEQLTKQYANEALEISRNATAVAETIRARARANKEVIVQKSYVDALKSFYQRLNVTKESHKLSLMLVRSLEDIQPNLYKGYGYDVNKLYGP